MGLSTSNYGSCGLGLETSDYGTWYFYLGLITLPTAIWVTQIFSTVINPLATSF